MTIDEAIQQARYVADEHSDCWRNCENIEKCCKECEYEHEQIAEWLGELKAYREIGTVEECMNCVLDILKAYNKAIDDFVKECDKKCGFYGGINKQLTRDMVLEIAEQLKESVSNDN